MDLGNYTELKGALHRVVREATQRTLRFDGEGHFYIVKESFLEVKNCTTGRLEFIVVEEQREEFQGITHPNDKTAFCLPTEVSK